MDARPTEEMSEGETQGVYVEHPVILMHIRLEHRPQVLGPPVGLMAAGATLSLQPCSLWPPSHPLGGGGERPSQRRMVTNGSSCGVTQALSGPLRWKLESLFSGIERPHALKTPPSFH